MKKLLLVNVFLFIVIVGFSQPANNNCNTAQAISVPTPPPCPNGNGATTTIAGTNVGATPGNPYVYQTACNPGGPMNTFQNDVWYSFVATGYQAIINIGGGTLTGINLAVWSGNCANLQGRGCATSNTNSVTLTVEQLVIGQIYYIQVSGNNGNSGTFNLTIDNNIDCQDCLTSATITANPPPVNGAYQPGQTVTFCFKVNTYNQINTNWLHGVQVTLGAGWNPATLVPTTTPPPCQGTGQWLWLPSCTSTATGQTFGQGWYFDTTDPGTNPGNNFGDNCSGQISAANWNFCFSVTTPTVCNSGSNLSVTINTSGDGESGSWASLGCFDDPPVTLNAVGACCPPTFSTTPSGCAGNNGTATATPVNCVGAPYSYTWTGPAGYTNTTTGVSGGNCSNTVTGLAPGVYTVSMTNSVNCVTTTTLTVASSGTNPVATASNTGPYCTGTTIQLNSTGGGTYAWSGPGGFTSSLQNPTIPSSTTAMSGVYTVTVTASGCTATASTTVTVNPLPVPTASNTGPYCAGTTIQLNGTGGGTYAWSGPGGFTSNQQNPTRPNSTSAMSGVYTVTVTLSGCTATASTTVTVNPLPVPTASNTGPYCEGAPIQLNSTGGGTYSWSGPGGFTSLLQNPTQGVSTVSMSGVYTVTVTLTNCTATASTTVTVNPLPVLTTVSSTVCVGNAGNISVSGASTYTWTPVTNPVNGNQVSDSPLTTTIYTVTGTDINNCVNVQTATITVNPLPLVSVGSVSVCAGITATLTASGASTYTWTAGTAPGTGATVSVTSSVNATFTVTGTDANGCVNTATATVTINPGIIVDAGPSDTICYGDNINLLATGSSGVTYTWNFGGGQTATGASQTIPALVSGVATFSVDAVDAFGCSGTDSVTITVTPQITLNAGGFPETCNGACNGQVVVLASPTTGPFANYSYLWSNNSTSPSSNNMCSGTWSVTVTDGAGCSDTASAVVTSPVALTANASGVSDASCNAACDGSATINANGGSGGYTYTWAPTGTGSNPTNLCAGNYTCTVSDANNCSVQVPVVINQPTPITVSITPVATICIGQSANLNSTAGGGNGGFVYTWTGGTNPTNLSGVSASPTVTTVYTVSVTDVNNCPAAAASVTVTVNPPLSVVASNDVTICGGQNGNLSANASGGNGSYTYTWATGTTPVTGTNVSASPSSTTIYTVTITDGCGTPAATDVVSIIVNPAPTLSITTGPPSGCAPWCVTFTANSNPASASCNWVFSDNQTASNNCTPNICFNNPGSYGATLNVTDINGCTNSITNNNLVNVYPVPVADFTWSPQPISELSPNVTFYDQSTGGTMAGWQWEFGDPLDNTSLIQNPSFFYAGAGNYDVTLTVVNSNGCIDSVTYTIVIVPEFSIYVPNAFTPGNDDGSDGVNDEFYPKGVGIDTENFEMWIYDRWGNNIFYTNDFTKHWDGKVQGGSGKLVQQDVYVWKIKLKTEAGDNKSYVGHVTVIR